jgi:hypothetical protein
VPLSVEVLLGPLHTFALGGDLALVKALQRAAVVEDEEDLMEAVVVRRIRSEQLLPPEITRS